MVGLQTRYASSATHTMNQLPICSYPALTLGPCGKSSKNGLQPQTQPYRRLKIWWNQMLSAGRTDRTAAKNRATKLIYMAWNIWK
jgi:hypothetical protein